MNAKEKRILKNYPISIWLAKDGIWKAYIPDTTKPRNRRIVQSKDRMNLEKKILRELQSIR